MSFSLNFPVVMLGLVPSIQGGQPSGCPRTFGTRPRVTYFAKWLLAGDEIGVMVELQR